MSSGPKPAGAGVGAAASASVAASKSATIFSSHLANSALNLIAIRDYYRSELSQLLSQTPAKSASSMKTLVVDRSISGPLGLVAEVELLLKNGVDREIQYLKPGPLVANQSHIIYLIRPLISSIRLIGDQIHHHRSQGKRHTYAIIFVPRKSLLCEKQLESEGIRGDISIISEFHLELIPFETDVLSLEYSPLFKEFFVEAEISSLFYIAKSIMKLQAVFGTIPLIKGKGGQAYRVFQLLHRLRRELLTQSNSGGSAGVSSPLQHSEISELILIDRTVDLVSPLLTQLTYEGLLDEHYGIRNSYIEVDAEIIESKGEGLKKLSLNSNDTLFKETRDLPFRILGPLLHKKAEYIKDTYSDRHNVNSVNEMHSFMQKFKSAHAEHSLLQTHINLAEKIAQKTKSKLFDRRVEMERMAIDGKESEPVEEYIESLIARQAPLTSVLRLIGLYVATHSKGLQPKKHELWRNLLIQTYGYETNFTLNNLEKLGLFVAGQKRTFQAVRKALKLTSADFPNSAPTNPTGASNGDIATIYNGFAPLSCRLIELAARGGWRKIEETLAFLPGKHFEFAQETGNAIKNWNPNAQPVNLLEQKVGPSGAPVVASGQPSPRAAAGNASGAGVKKPLVLVYFIGGVTYSEISALRALSESPGHPCEYVVATSKLVNGNSLIESVQETLVNKLKKK